MPTWFSYIFPIVTLILGIFLELLREYIVKSKEQHNEFLKQRFSALLFPLFIYMQDYKKVDLSDPIIFSTEYYLDKAKYANNILLNYSFYASAELITAYIHFTAELYDHVHIRENLKNVDSEYQAFMVIATSEYIDLSEKLLKHVKSLDYTK